jgi:signal transduction histidine kinase
MQATAPPDDTLNVDLSEGSSKSLGIYSTLQDLPLYSFIATVDDDIDLLMEHFARSPHLPGVIFKDEQHISVLSRQQFLECLLQIGQTSLFSAGLLRLMTNQANRDTLLLEGNTPILQGARQALKRSHAQQNDPILVRCADHYQLLDARTLNVAHWQIRGIETQIRYERLQMQLLQSEKMAALGRLVDGVAHEILDPVSFIWGNLSYIADYAQRQQTLLKAYDALLPDALPAELSQLQTDLEIEYIREDLPDAIRSARGGAHRLRQLATSLQNFCHIDEVHPRPTDLNSLIDSTLRLLKSRLNSTIQIERCYGKLPPVPCFSGQLSQVFMTLFTNAIESLLAQAQLEDYSDRNAITPIAILSDKVPQITITTCVRPAHETSQNDPNESRWVSIIISDNGPGLSPHTEAQIIESFSTERRAGKETGLTLSYQIITAKHGGKFWLRSFHADQQVTHLDEVSPTGTEFEILLPLTIRE